MNKPAATDHDVHALIRERWSPRAFSSQSLGDRQLRSLLEAARWAPSCFNEQPWRFIVARRDDETEFERMCSCLNEKNQAWARTAPVLMLTVARTTFTRNDRPNRHAWHDVGQATLSLSLQATALGLYAHQMAGILPDHARSVYGIPDTFEAVTGLALGYLGDPAVLPENYRGTRTTPRTRRPLEETVFAEHWGAAAPVVSEAGGS